MLYPQITIIIPAFNCRDFLRQAVLSVVGQPYKNISVIIVDDGSTDGTYELCEALSSELYEFNITVVHQKNSGVSAARNVGISHAIQHNPDGYMVFLDSDDVWEDDFLTSDIVKKLCEGFDVVGFEHCEASANLTEKRRISNPTSNTVISGGNNAVWAHERRHIGCLFFRNGFIAAKDISFPEGLRYNEDEIFKVYCEILSEKMAFYDNPMYVYRLHSSSAVHNLGRDVIGRYSAWIDAWRNADKLLLEKHSIKTSIGKSFANNYMVEMCIEHIRALHPFKELSPHIDFNALCNEDPDNYSEHLRKDFLLLRRSKFLFCLKHRIIGILILAKRSISKIRKVHK